MNRQERVWVVDDDRSIRWVLCRALQSAGFQAIEFEDAERASAALADNEPDAIVSDVRMPGRSGFDLLAELRERAPQVPVIITTAYQRYAVEGYEHRVVDYLMKPIEFSRFLSAINKVNDSPAVTLQKSSEEKPERPFRPRRSFTRLLAELA